jgi:FkbM family methyltransferase
VKRWLRSFGRSLIPPRLRLPLTFQWERWKGGIEDELWIIERWEDLTATAIDVGANQGFYAYKLARWFRIVEAFEPNARIAGRIREYASPRITTHCVALSGSNGEANLHVPVSATGVEYPGWGSLEATSLPVSQQINIEAVPARTLDSYMLEGVAVIKIDVEGHECAVLRGSRETIGRCRPVILVEVKPPSCPFVERFFAELNYRTFVLVNGELLATGERLANLRQENVFALPAER